MSKTYYNGLFYNKLFYIDFFIWNFFIMDFFIWHLVTFFKRTSDKKSEEIEIAINIFWFR